MPATLEGAFKQREEDISNITSRSDVDVLQQRLDALEALSSITPASSPDYTDIQENIGYAASDAENAQIKAARSYNERLGNIIGTRTKIPNINKRTTTLSGKHEYYRQARGSENLYQPTELIEAGIQEKMQQVNTLGREVAGRTRGLGQEDVPATVLAKAGQIGDLERDIALDKRMLKVQNKAGLSTEKVFGRAEEVMDRTSSYFEQETLKERVANRNVRDIGEESAALGTKQGSVFVAQEQFDKAMEDSVKDMSSFTKALKDATDALEDQQSLVEEMKRQGVTGPGSDDMGWGDAGKVIALGGRALAHTARSARVLAVDQQREEMQHKTSFAALGNRIYNRADEAIMGGNMDALLELTGGSLSFAKKEGMFAKTFTNVSEGIAQVGDAAVGVGNTTQAFIDGTKASVVAGKVAAISQGVIETGSAAVRLGDLARGNVGARQVLPTVGAALGLSAQMRAMDSRMMQTVYDQGMTTYNSVSGLGGAGNIQAKLMNTETLGKMAGVGLTPERAAQLTSGLRAAGAMSAGDATSVIRSAGAAKQRGVLGQEEYVGMAAQLMGAGGGAGDLESIIASATAAGMDNSKSIGELVSGTLALSQGLNAAGVSGTGSTQSMLAKASQGLVAAGVDPNLAANVAASSIQSYNQAQAGQGFTLGNIIERSGLRRMGANFNNASAFQLNRMGEMSSADHKVLLDAAKNPDNAEMQNTANQLLKAKNISEVLNPEGKGIKVEDVREMQKLSFIAAATDKGALGVRGVDLGEIWDKAVNKKKLTEKEGALFQEFGGGRAEAITSAMVGIGDNPSTQEPNSKKKLMGAGAETTAGLLKVKEMTDLEKKGGASSAEIFKSLEVTLSGLQENIGPEKIAKVVEDAAANFNVPVLEFKTSTDEFSKAVGKFVKWQEGRMNAAGENQPKPDPNNTIKKQNESGKQRIHPKTGMPW